MDKTQKVRAKPRNKLQIVKYDCRGRCNSYKATYQEKKQ